MRAASIAAAVGAVAGLVALVGFRAGAWLLDAVVGWWFRKQAGMDGDSHDLWPTNMECV